MSDQEIRANIMDAEEEEAEGKSSGIVNKQVDNITNGEEGEERDEDEEEEERDYLDAVLDNQLLEEEYTPAISALPPKVVKQEENQVEVSASPAFQCLDEVKKMSCCQFICLLIF